MADPVKGFVLDSGAIVAAERNDRQFWILWKTAIIQDLDILIPSTVLAQTWRGSKNHRMSLVLKSCAVEVLSEQSAKAVGELCARAAFSDIVDAHVAVAAYEKKFAIITADSGDLVPLANLLDKKLRVVDLTKIKNHS